ncbi:T9SS type A sorting domain-containing protein [Formosa sp. A9]
MYWLTYTNKSLSPGIYFIKVSSQNKQETKKIVIK